MVIAIPVSFGLAFFLTEVAPRWLRAPVGTAIELLAGIPSIIYGMWGLFVLVPVMTTYVTPCANDHLCPLPLLCALFLFPPFFFVILTAFFVLSIIFFPFFSSLILLFFLSFPSLLIYSSFSLFSSLFFFFFFFFLF